ncbi:hypothetical protein QAD02_005740 [Eretmocerus hayati]|uniref:Uncharacterized protein n=1 Tax=Eretmocerus hayati TaxID=131215 RepID=A0ACC2NUE9_9HYME|nr:hypothetical protein QAD02_005740 [Eretmocerus hayati]
MARLDREQKMAQSQKMCVAQYMFDHPEYAANVKDTVKSQELERLVNAKSGPTRTQKQIKQAWRQVATSTAKATREKGEADFDEYQKLVLKAVRKRDAYRMKEMEQLTEQSSHISH